MKITKTTITTYDVKFFGKFPNTWGEFKEVRERIGMSTNKLQKCIICNKAFELDESLYIASVSKKGNRFVCETCYLKHGKE